MQISYDQVNSSKFIDFYRKAAAPHLIRIEKYRQQQLDRVRQYVINSTFASIFIAFVLFSTPIAKFLLEANGIGIIVVAMLAPFLSIRKPYNEYKKKCKDILVPVLLNFCGNLKRLDCEISKDVIKNMGLFDTFSKLECDDYFTGSHKGVKVEIAEIYLERGNDNDRVNVFKGVVCILNLNKKFKGKTLVLKDKGVFNFINHLTKGLKNVKLEDPIFEKHFEVYSSDQIEARYLLTTAFMQRLIDINNIFNSKISCCFNQDKLMIAIPTLKNMFEVPNLFMPINQAKKHKEYIAEITSLMSIVEILKLEQYTGM